ncbi:MAG: adenylate kinase family protein [Vulcanisaeta sp. AZ3]|jgi:adenylate kinase
MVRLLVTGTPGVGKTTIAMELSRTYGIPMVNINEVLKPVLKWDAELMTNYITDENRARILVRDYLRSFNSYIIDTVAVNLFDESLIDWCIVLRLNPLYLMDRLSRRGWSRCKVVENVLAEVVGSSISMAINVFGVDRVIEVDTTGMSVHEVVNSIINYISSGRAIVGVVDWLDFLDTGTIISLDQELSKCLSILNDQYT